MNGGQIGGKIGVNPLKTYVDEEGKVIDLGQGLSSSDINLTDFIDTDEGSSSGHDDDRLNKKPNSKLFPPKNRMFSEMHIFSGIKFDCHEVHEIGMLCPDEILDIELDLNQNLRIDESQTNLNLSQESMSIRQSVD